MTDKQAERIAELIKPLRVKPGRACHKLQEALH
jgi:hypothetical protein